MTIDKGTCCVDSCDRTIVKRGFCNRHYIRFNRYGDPLGGRPVGRPPRCEGPCDVEGCDRPAKTSGLCGMHYERKRATGVVGPPHPLPRCDRKKRHPINAGPCAFSECENPAHCKGLCSGHWNQQAKGRDLSPLKSFNRVVDGMKRCNVCDEVKPISEFGKKLTTVTEHCRECRGLKLRSEAYGISLDEVREMLEQTHCDCCGTRFTNRRDQQIDHCHLTDDVRGLLCQKCNTALGCVNDDVEVLRGLVAYIERSRN
jgi:hypothetical protein